jgi:hypothetical protein
MIIETYASDTYEIGSRRETTLKVLYDDVKTMKLPSIIAFYSLDIDRDEALVTNSIPTDADANTAIDIFTRFFKDKLTNAEPQELSEDTKRAIDALLADSDEDSDI